MIIVIRLLELNAKMRKSIRVASNGKCLCSAVNCNSLRMMKDIIRDVIYPYKYILRLLIKYLSLKVWQLKI